MEDTGSGLRPSPSSTDVALVVEAVEAAEERLAQEAEEEAALLAGGVGAAEDAKRAAAYAARRGAPDPAAASLLRRSAPFSSGDFISGQVHENDQAEVVIVCEPDLHSNIMGALHPAGSLYERPVNMRRCAEQHEAFRAALRAHGVRCLTVREILLYDTEASVRARCELEDLAAARLRYELEPNCDANLVSASDRFYIGDAYKRTVLESSSAEQLVDIVLCGPTVHVLPSFRDTGFTARYSFEPLTNVQFTRDQQVCTARGIVMARLRSQQRQCEVELLDFCLRKVGLPIVGRITPPGYLEGGDFFPAGDLCFIGIGLRSNEEAAFQLMRENLLGTSRVAVVRDCFEVDQTRMHLDCVFNIIGDDVVMLAEDIIGENCPLRRLVDEYVVTGAHGLDGATTPVSPTSNGTAHTGNGNSANGDAPPPAPSGTGAYTLKRSGIEFSSFLREEGYHIIPISREHQLQYGCNVLNLGDSHLLSCHPETARQLVRCPQFHGSVQLLEFGAVTSMYGALHCSSGVLRRRPRAAEEY